MESGKITRVYIQGPIYIRQGGARRGLDWARKGIGQGGS